jgi:hypothetical protein
MRVNFLQMGGIDGQLAAWCRVRFRRKSTLLDR